MRENVEQQLAKFIKDLDCLRDEQEHFIEEVKHEYNEKIRLKSTQIENLKTELQLAREKAKDGIFEKTLLENQSVVIDDLTVEVKSLRTTNTDLENEMKRVNLAHSEETRRLRDEMATMERDFRERIVYLERQVGEEREVEKFNAQFKDFAQIVEDLKTVKMNTEAQQDLIKQTATQMQNKHEDVLRQFRENCQNSTKELFKLIQEEDQRMCRLREELGLCGDLENRWRTQIKDNLLGDVDEGVLTMGIRCQLEETIRALHATVETLKRRSTTLEKDNMKLRARLLRHGDKFNLTNKSHRPNASGDYSAF
ncbi:hypothetical protein EGR_03602 [Echinococcus granulosus]|uniref:Uncharacterized protein n=1 Tax=Echinococcus granulosus TaxID=6210 RepID=W6UKE3_ECHGR|nr:hypothetical protein EGR_03602 [Echinococcus granulosus]EUB61538.1 hypothetical protein EGR_03602 [Echinococcus granulosus]